MFDGTYFKIGESNNPMTRLLQLKTGNANIEMVCFGFGVSEKELHSLYSEKRIELEWFDLGMDDVVFIYNSFLEYFAKNNNGIRFKEYMEKFQNQFATDFISIN